MRVVLWRVDNELVGCALDWLSALRPLAITTAFFEASSGDGAFNQICTSQVLFAVAQGVLCPLHFFQCSSHCCNLCLSAHLPTCWPSHLFPCLLVSFPTCPPTCSGASMFACVPAPQLSYQDERYRHLVGREAEVPLSGGRRIPIIADDVCDGRMGREGEGWTSGSLVGSQWWPVHQATSSHLFMRNLTTVTMADSYHNVFTHLLYLLC